MITERIRFRAADGGFTPDDTEARLIGRFTISAGTFTFFGRGPVRIVP